MKYNKAPIKIKDISQIAGVSTGTVDRVLHNRSDVSEKTREKVLRIIDELGYKTNIIAKTLASKKPIVFSTLIPIDDKYSSYWKKPLIGIKKAEEEFSAYGVVIKKYFFKINDKESFKKQANLILKDLPKAVVVAPIFQKEALEFVTQLKNIGIPFVFLDSTIEQEKGNLGYVGHDSYQSGRVAAKLIETRTTNKDTILLVNFLGSPTSQNHLLQRSIGFRSFFTEKDSIGALVEIDIINLNEASIEDKLSHIFHNISQIGAIFVACSKVHLIAKYLEEHQLQNKVILVGYDLIDENITYLKNDTIDYLISQNPIEQGHRSIEKIFQTVILKQQVEKITYFSIDIIIKENEMYC